MSLEESMTFSVREVSTLQTAVRMELDRADFLAKKPFARTNISALQFYSTI